MTDTPPALDPRTSALLVMDFQQGILASLPGLAAPEALLSRVAGAIADMRTHGATIAYVRVAFTEADWTAIPPTNKTFSYLGQQRLMHHADPATDIHHRLAPEPGDITVRKTRYSALSTTDLDRRLRDREITTLVIAGITTTGAVLSTVTDAADRDYQIYILSDAITDPDPQTHQTLMTGIFPRLAHIIDTTDLHSLLHDGRPRIHPETAEDPKGPAGA
ncbi:isochorismatase [Sphaerisporangium siamense]|uniref:Nicotinamidase-related amidase n=1 Tax=Sphaerisporangium siamense TaxID=795645 RepID=A0A7W7D2S5_9ACTN|nr:cysteine hydrolase [Sphaerisporangium siamense]MBB4699254.1 nicotinamidase-related amidase [Sphaerisporangium siamense]GII86619.1 isochorismatase [Sphaerisporangium siamense]